MKYILTGLALTVFFACTKQMDNQPADHNNQVTIHDTLYRLVLDTITKTKYDTVVKYNADTLNKDPNHTDTIIIKTTKTDTLIQWKYDTIRVVRTDSFKIVKTDTFTIIRIDSVSIIDTVYGMFASRPSTGLNHIAINNYRDSSKSNFGNTYIVDIRIGGVKYFVKNGYIDVPDNQQTDMYVDVSYNTFSSAVVSTRDYFDPYVEYSHVLQTVGPGSNQAVYFPYVNTSNLAIITVSDFGLNEQGPAGSSSAHSHWITEKYREIKN
jgi:hypothetical protein